MVYDGVYVWSVSRSLPLDLWWKSLKICSFECKGGFDVFLGKKNIECVVKYECFDACVGYNSWDYHFCMWICVKKGFGLVQDRSGKICRTHAGGIKTTHAEGPTAVPISIGWTAHAWARPREWARDRVPHEWVWRYFYTFVWFFYIL